MTSEKKIDIVHACLFINGTIWN